MTLPRPPGGDSSDPHEFRLMVPERTPLGAAKALGLFCIYIGAQILVAVIVFAGYGLLQPEPPPDVFDAEATVFLLAGAVGILVGGLAVFLVTRSLLPGSGSTGSMASLGWVKPARGWLLGGAALGMGIAGVALVGLPRIIPADEGAEGYLVQAASAPGWSRVVFVVLAVLLAPVVEEFVFRGVMFAGLSRSWGAVPAGVVVTVLFGLLHITEAVGYWPSLVVVTLAGAAMLMVRVRSGSLLPAIALHMAYNSVQVAVLYAPL